ncbi:MAG: hypothetical protein A3K22_02100 [Deltaproteobacteria bacterium RBG_16_42_7]|nr:MAG: hypothetical protein A3K22_02100 [Deltaproteobacteria bacterium RBG_16_42_7]
MLDLSKRILPKFSWSTITCGEACWSAKEHDCKCSCGGKNHGIWLHGGHAERTHKHNGHTYKLVAVDNTNNIHQLQEEKLDGYGIYRCYDYYGNGEFKHQTYRDYYRCRGDKDISDFPVVAKKPTMDQIERWHELKEHKGLSKIDWYRLDILLLWEIMEKPAPVKHECC